MVLEVGSCIIGIFAYENGKITEFKLFPKDPKAIAEKMTKIENGEETEETTYFTNKYNIKIINNPDFLKNNLREMAVKYGFVKDSSEFNQLLTQINIEKSKTKIKGLDRKDRLIIHAISALNDLDKIINVMTERLREWYGLYYPELRIKDHETFVKSVSFERKESMGAELTQEDFNVIKDYAVKIEGLMKTKNDIERYLGKNVPIEMPNTNALLGSLLAARLMAQAGSLEKLARMSSSTIQLLGSEKALFKFLRGQQQTVPKHGIIFVHPDVSNAPLDKRGKIARLLSSKISLAARADFYTKNDISKELLEDYKKKVAEACGQHEN